jgi:site-specific recombinase XerD
MRKHHPKNERIKREYLVWLEEAKRMNSSSVDQVAAAIAQFEESTGHRDFAAFHFEQARKFKRVLVESTSPATGAGLAKATIYSRLMAVKAFFVWLAAPVGLQVSSHTLGHGLFQSIQQRRADRESDPGKAGADARTDPPRSFCDAHPVGHREA